ncbi:juvenile hormone esterase-like [Cylas formicarius]|uniref:juvenile hormone esterase-like n=1 Tax=Cylas formicarius TaxID=197179 RepID=UPI00295877C2|nr:juvenile hormone esterase-like [Cylas formicarius]
MRGFLVFLVFLLLLATGVCMWLLWPAFSSEYVIVSTPLGKIKGSISKSPNNHAVHIFQGIPYAVPPLGKLRFQETQPKGKWNGILDATKEGKSCVGAMYLDEPAEESEDCLQLNVYTPSLKMSERVPVMAYIHGGRYAYGSGRMSALNPLFIVEEDVVVVTFNYRLGPFGYLSTEDTVVPGNAGMKDQLIALQWIKKNIRAFGGDTSKITLFGQSAGGSACGLHLVSRKSAGLFRAAICQSGSALTPFSIYRSPRKYAYLLANLIDQKVSEESHNSSQLLEFLNAQSLEAITTAGNILSISLEKEDGLPAPSIEVEHENAFLWESPYTLLESGDFNRVPLITGIVSEEALTQLPSWDELNIEAKKLDTEEEYIFPYGFVPANASDDPEIEKFIKDMYIQDDSSFSENLFEAVQLKSDNLFNRGVIKHAELQSVYTDVFLYQFAYSGELNTPHLDVLGAEGKCEHGDDIRYLFVRKDISLINAGDKLTIERMVKLWTNFAKYLNPTPNSEDLLGNVMWPKLQPQNLVYLNISDTIDLGINLKEETYFKWNYTFFKWGARPFVTF